MIYAVDSIINDIVKLENIKTKEIIFINKNSLPKKIMDGTIVEFKDNEYIINEKIYNDRKKMIQDKFERLKNIKNN